MAASGAEHAAPHRSREGSRGPAECATIDLTGGGSCECAFSALVVDVVDTSEFARVFGIDFFSVLSRGSQYRVESLMLRLAKTENFVALSPSKRQVENQMAPEAIPLVMEPQSRFYASPVVVLDFQSLYPSVMIAYNYWCVRVLRAYGNGRCRVELSV